MEVRALSFMLFSLPRANSKAQARIVGVSDAVSSLAGNSLWLTIETSLETDRAYNPRLFLLSPTGELPWANPFAYRPARREANVKEVRTWQRVSRVPAQSRKRGLRQVN